MISSQEDGDRTPPPECGCSPLRPTLDMGTALCKIYNLSFSLGERVDNKVI